MGCCCLSDSTVQNRSRSISNEKVASSDPNKVTIYKNGKESINSNNPNSNNESFSNATFETIPYFDEFNRIFEEFIGRVNRNYNLNKSRLIDFSNKWGALLMRVQKALSGPSENKIKDLFHSRLLQVSRISKYKEKNSNIKAEIPNKSNSIIEEKEEDEFEVDIKENSSKESSFHKQTITEKPEKPLDFASLNKEKFIIYIQKAKFFENIANMEHPHIVVKVKPDLNNKEIVEIFETKKVEMKVIPEWQEAFRKDFEFGRKIDLNKAVFIVELLYFDSKSQLLNSLGENTFTLDEIKNQQVTQKVIKYTKLGKVFAELFIKCQFIYDYKDLLTYWERTVKVKKEIADRFILKSHKTHSEGEEEKNNGLHARSVTEENMNLENNGDSIPVKGSSEFKENSSILSMEEQSLAQSGFFDNQFYVKN